MRIYKRVESVIASLYFVESRSIVPIIDFVFAIDVMIKRRIYSSLILFASWRNKNNSLIKHNLFQEQKNI